MNAPRDEVAVLRGHIEGKLCCLPSTRGCCCLRENGCDVVRFDNNKTLPRLHCVCVCVIIPFILDVKFVDVPAGVTQEEGHTVSLHLPSPVLAFIILARRILQSFLSLVDRKIEFCVLTF